LIWLGFLLLELFYDFFFFFACRYNATAAMVSWFKNISSHAPYADCLCSMVGERPYKSVSGKTMQLKSLSWDLHKLSFWASVSLLMVFSWDVQVYLNDLH